MNSCENPQIWLYKVGSRWGVIIRGIDATLRKFLLETQVNSLDLKKEQDL